MNRTPRYGTTAVSTPRTNSNLTSVLTPSTPGYVASAASSAKLSRIPSDFQTSSLSESDATTLEEVSRRSELENTGPSRYHFNANNQRSLPAGNVSRYHFNANNQRSLPAGNVPTPDEQANTGVLNLISPWSSSGDTSRWSGTKKQKLDSTPRHTGRSALSWRHHTLGQDTSTTNDFTTPRLPLDHHQLVSESGGPTYKANSIREIQHNKGPASVSSGSSDDPPITAQMNKAFQLSSNESYPLSDSRETALRNSSNISTLKETTPSSDISRLVQIKATRGPFTESSSSTRSTEDSRTAKDVTHTRPKSRNRHVLSDEEQSNQVQELLLRLKKPLFLQLLVF